MVPCDRVQPAPSQLRRHHVPSPTPLFPLSTVYQLGTIYVEPYLADKTTRPIFIGNRYCQKNAAAPQGCVIQNLNTPPPPPILHLTRRIGSIPEQLGNLPWLKMLDLGNNKLDGESRTGENSGDCRVRAFIIYPAYFQFMRL